jgi:hypothetical protein
MLEGKRPFGRTRHRWYSLEGKIKMHITDTGYKDVVKTYLAQCRVQ